MLVLSACNVLKTVNLFQALTDCKRATVDGAIASIVFTNIGASQIKRADNQ
jgi:hypothetical protein